MTVVVVGAGPVGVTAALLLARHGVDVLLLDRHHAAYPQPRAVHLDDEALRVLQAAGVAEAFSSISRPMAGLRLLDGAHRTLGEFPRGAGEHGWPQGSMFSQPDLEAVLRRALADEPRAELRGGSEVVQLADPGGPVRLTVRDRDTGAEEELVADAVLGCDGAHSTVRRLIGARMRDLAPAERWLVVDLLADVPPVVWPGVHQVCDAARPATFMPITGPRYRAEFRLHDGETPADLDLPALLASFGADGCTVTRAAEYTFAAQVADRWRSGRVLLCGDAAHLTPPFIGQGLGLGLRDVHQLAWKLAAVLDGADDALLDTHQAERAPHARSLIRVAALLGRLMTGGGRGAAVVRRAVLTGVRRLPRLSAFASSSRTPPLRPGPLVRRPRFGRRSPVGGLLPQPPIDGPGRLDDVLGLGWAVLTAGGPVPPDWPGRVWRADELGSPELARWLGCRSVLVRPDRIVAAVDHRRLPRRSRSESLVVPQRDRMGAARRVLVTLGVGAAFGTVDSLVNAASSPYTRIGDRVEGTGGDEVAQFLGLLLDAGWAWASVAVVAGWLAGGLRRSALTGAAALLAATTAYYATDSWTRGESFSGYAPELARWWAASAVLGAVLGAIGAAGRRPGVTGLLARLIVPLGAAVQMAVSPPGFGGRPVPVEAVAARWSVWTAAAVTTALVVARGAAAHRAARPTRR